MKKFLICASLVFAFLFGACANTVVSAEQTNPLKIWHHNENGNYHTMCVVDDDTGVNYVVVAFDTGGGTRSVTICPRYYANGDLYVS